MRRLVVLLGGTPCDQKAATTAVALAKRLGAHVEGLFTRLDASELVPRLGEGMSSVAIESILEASQIASEEAATRARAALTQAADAGGVEIATGLPARPGLSVYFHDLTGPVDEIFDSEARLADLLVFGEPGEDAPVGWTHRIERGLLALRRPILVARGGVSANFGEKILVSYDGSLEAANALVHAAPILVAAKEVEVLQIHEGEKGVDHAGAAVRYLRQHGANASAHDMKLTRGHVGEEIAARANSVWASLIVMGGYGRSRLREFILGGATRHLINHAPVPVLLAH
jgi:nucleotide-binding universal stress UspA family protein